MNNINNLMESAAGCESSNLNHNIYMLNDAQRVKFIGKIIENNGSQCSRSIGAVVPNSDTSDLFKNAALMELVNSRYNQQLYSQQFWTKTDWYQFMNEDFKESIHIDSSNLPKKTFLDLGLPSIIDTCSGGNIRAVVGCRGIESFSQKCLAMANYLLIPTHKSNESSEAVGSKEGFKKHAFKALAFCDSSLRFAARIIYGTAVGIIAAPAGAVNHSVNALYCGIAPVNWGGSTKLAKNHAMAGVRDVAYSALTLTGLIGPVVYACFPEKTAQFI